MTVYGPRDEGPDFNENVTVQTVAEVGFRGGNLGSPATAAVIALKISNLENGIKDLGDKMDTMLDKYPSKETLDLILYPIKVELLEVKNKLADKEKNDAQSRQQYRVAVVTAILSPFLSILIGGLMAAIAMGMKA